MKNIYSGSGASRASIKVIGVGNAGSNVVNRMAKAKLRGVKLITVNADELDLRRSQATVRIRIGKTTSNGMGAGGDLTKGSAAALESEARLKKALAGADMVFVTAGMGGGTGTGAAPVVAKLAKEAGALTIGVVTRPFRFEGLLPANIAQAGIEELRQNVDTLLVIPNDHIYDTAARNARLHEAFNCANDVVCKAVQSISDGITTPGTIQVDLNDLRAIMANAGEALIGMGEASGPNRAARAAKAATSSPLLENVDTAKAKGLLLNIRSGTPAITLSELDEVVEHIQSKLSPEAKVKVGKVYDESLGDLIRVTLILTGFRF